MFVLEPEEWRIHPLERSRSALRLEFAVRIRILEVPQHFR